MKPYIDAIRALLTAAGITSYYVDVPTTPTYPYVLLWSSSGIAPVEVPVSGTTDLTDSIGATTVAMSADGVLIVQKNARAALDGTHPVVSGRVTWLNLYDSLPVQVDRDVTPHVVYGVDMYRLISTA